MRCPKAPAFGRCNTGPPRFLLPAHHYSSKLAVVRPQLPVDPTPGQDHDYLFDITSGWSFRPGRTDSLSLSLTPRQRHATSDLRFTDALLKYCKTGVLLFGPTVLYRTVSSAHP